jgi:beta-galactosidase
MPKLGHLEWEVPYQPGRLEAISRTGGKVIARDVVETTGKAVALRLRTDRKRILADSEDLTPVEVDVIDAQGRVVPDAAQEVTFSIEGAGVIGGVGNGDPSDHDPDKANHRKAFNGHCMALVQSNGKTGSIRLVAKAAGLKAATLSLTAQGGTASK